MLGWPKQKRLLMFPQSQGTKIVRMGAETVLYGHPGELVPVLDGARER